MKLAICTMVRNEADRYLSPMLKAWGSFADTIVALNDGSDDDTGLILADHGADTRFCLDEHAWGNETEARSALWNWAMKKNWDWLLFLDADMVPLQDPRILMHSSADAVAFPLFDLWDTERSYRHDSLWQAHLNPRIWAVKRPSESFEATWSGRGIHSGHLPLNVPTERVIIAPPRYGILHYGYLLHEHRVEKYERYMSVADQLTAEERIHAESILDPSPNLMLLEQEPQWPVS